MACPEDWIRYNGTMCACGVGQLFNRSSNSCHAFTAASGIFSDAGVDYYALSFPGTIFSFDSIRRFTQSQAVFLEATLVALLSWLLFCFALRLKKLSDGSNLYFKLRWWISRLDIAFATRHWLEDQQLVKKRKTELGGTFSIASWILFVGLFAALLYQIITKRTVEVRNVKAMNAPDLASFINDIEFNITTVSGMSCSNLRGIGNLLRGGPGLDGYKRTALKNFASYTCQNTTIGPTINFKCSNCHLRDDYMYISWQFVDLPNYPATAVGFQFNFTTSHRDNKKQISFVSGTLRNGSVLVDIPVTFRGTATNVLKFHLMPRIYRNAHDLKLIQPLFHDFVPGSNYGDKNQLQASLERASDGLVNTTLFLNYLSAYVVEIDHQSILGPVSFLADLGGLYCISIGIFFYLLVQCEYRIKRFRSEDSVLRTIRRRRKAKAHWDKVRRYVAYTWGCSLINVDNLENTRKKPSICYLFGSSGAREGSDRKQKMDSVSFTKRSMKTIPKPLNICDDLKKNGEISSSSQCEGYSEHKSTSAGDDKLIPLPPRVDFRGSTAEEMEKNFQILYDYNMLLREKMLANQSVVDSLATKLDSSDVKTGGGVS